MMVSARGVADWHTNGQPIGNLTDSFAAIGSGWWPVIIFLAVAFIFHIALRYTRYRKFTYAIGANPLAARVSGIDVERHIVLVYMMAGLLSGLSGIVHTARDQRPGRGRRRLRARCDRRRRHPARRSPAASAA
jgi:inositol transport system permease protein